jgi:hypothetical protein
MVTTPSKSPSNQNNKPAEKPTEAAKPVADTSPKAVAEPIAPVQDTKPVAATDTASVVVEQIVEPVKAEVAQTPSNGAKPDTRTIISLSVSEKLARQIRLLAKLDGVTISNLVIASIEKEVPARLRVALAALTDLE